MKLSLQEIAAATALLLASQTSAADGKLVYNKSCAVCHTILAPKFGDKAAWESRRKQGTDALVPRC